MVNYALYFESSKAKIHINIGLRNNNPNQKARCLPNFFASHKQRRIIAIIGKKAAQIPNIKLISDLIISNKGKLHVGPKNRNIIDTINHIKHIMKVHRNRFLWPDILNNTQIFRIGIRDSRHFLQAFLNTIRIHTIIQIASTHHRIHQEVHHQAVF